MSDSTNQIVIRHVDPAEITFANLSLLETMAYLLMLSGCHKDDTTLNDQPIGTLLTHVYRKRQDFEINMCIGKALMKEGVISQDQLSEAIAYHLNTAAPLGAALISLKMCSGADVQRVMSEWHSA